MKNIDVIKQTVGNAVRSLYQMIMTVDEETYECHVIDWNNRDGREGKDNEIDVVLMYKSIPVFISCKMTKPSALDVSEVGFLSKRLAGQRGQAILATTEKIKETGNEKTKGIHYRMKEMHIGCIETNEFYTKSDKEVMLEALHSIGL